LPIKALLSVCALCLFLIPARAQETLTSVQRELDRVDKEIEREKELHKSERKRATDFEAEKAAKLKALQEQLRATGGRIDSLKRQQEKARQQKASFKAQSAQYLARQKEFLKAFAKQTRDLAATVRKDFPYDREKRAADLEDLAAALDNGTVGVEEGLNRFFTLSQANLDFAYETEVYRGSYRSADGSDKEGSFVRLGAALLAFAGDDGKTAAWLAKADTGYVWHEADVSPEIRENIFTAMKVAQGKVAPQLVSLPFQAPKLVEGGK